MEVRAQAYQEYNQAAILDKLLAGLPDVVRALSEPLAKVDKITVVSTGAESDGQGAGVNKVTADMATVIAQVPSIIEALTGVKLGDLMRQVPQIQQAMESPDGRAPVAEEALEATVAAPKAKAEDSSTEEKKKT
jgi:flotillin